MPIFDYRFTKVYFGDYCLTDHFAVMNVKRPFSKKTIELVDLPGRDGAVVGSMTYDPVVITMDLAVVGGNRGQRSDRMRELAALFNNEEPQYLWFTDDHDDPGMRYPCYASGGDIERYINLDNIVGVTFTCPEAAAYGALVTETVNAGATVTMDVDGNYPTKPTITIQNAVPYSGVVGITDTWSDGSYTYSNMLEIPLSANASEIVIDCEKRTVFVDGVSTVPTLLSDWFSFVPGSHSIAQVPGSGDVTIEYYERWL